METSKMNNLLLTKLSDYLNNYDTSITTNQINRLTKMGVSPKKAFLLLLANYLELDDCPDIIELYFPEMINELDPLVFMNDRYYQNIEFKNRKYLDWELRIDHYNPYQAFVCDDFKYFEDGRVVPQIGFFNRSFSYPTIYQNGQLWMSITPNEILTMASPIKEAHGNVITFGLGLGYYIYMCLLKPNVDSMIVVEKDPNVIKLFKTLILPQFKNTEKLTIINQDAFEFLEHDLSNHQIDFLFADIWHDAGDGKQLYLQIKAYEKRYPKITFRYWIEKTLKYYC